ncbi:hypothetical protein FQN54_003954 [Arachnomyces sp. PD_36]|nr:hypothetical protein FQN54_003954 [Arachnomyces sp. PD_36]
MFEIMNIFYVAVWATGILAALEGVSLLEDIQDIPELSKPPYHPDLIPASRLSAGITVFTEIWAGVLMVTTVVMFNSKSTTGGDTCLDLLTSARVVKTGTAGLLARALMNPATQRCSVLSQAAPESVATGILAKDSYSSTIWNLPYWTKSIAAFTVVSIGLGLYLVFMDEDRQHTTAGSYPLENRDEYKVLGSTQDGAWKAAEHGDDQGTSEEIRIVRNSSRNPFAKRRVNELHFVRWWLGKTPEQLERQRQREMQDQSG